MEAGFSEVLETILRTANAEVYTPAFINNNVDILTLPLLTEEDLQVIGVDNSNVRKTLLKSFAKVQTPRDAQSDLTITEEYCDAILNQLFAQLSKHQAVLVSIINRKDLLVLNIPLRPASGCFTEAICSLKHELDCYEQKFKPVKKSRRAAKQVLVITGACAITILFIGKLIRIIWK